jgi:hypothetical protein
MLHPTADGLFISMSVECENTSSQGPPGECVESLCGTHLSHSLHTLAILRSNESFATCRIRAENVVFCDNQNSHILHSLDLTLVPFMFTEREPRAMP